MNFGFASVRMIWVLIKTNQKKIVRNENLNQLYSYIRNICNEV